MRRIARYLKENKQDFVKTVIELLEQDDNKKLLEIKQIIEEHDEDSMPEDYFYIDKIREVIQK